MKILFIYIYNFYIIFILISKSNRAKGLGGGVDFFGVFGDFLGFFENSLSKTSVKFFMKRIVAPKTGHVRRARKVKNSTRWSGPLARLLFLIFNKYFLINNFFNKMNRAKCPKEGVNFLKTVSGTFAVQGIENFDALVRAISPV